MSQKLFVGLLLLGMVVACLSDSSDQGQSQDIKPQPGGDKDSADSGKHSAFLEKSNQLTKNKPAVDTPSDKGSSQGQGDSGSRGNLHLEKCKWVEKIKPEKSCALGKIQIPDKDQSSGGQQKGQQDKMQQDKMPQDKGQQDKMPQDKMPQDKMQQDKMQQDKMQQDKMPQDKMQQDKMPQDQMQQDKMPLDKMQQDKMPQDKGQQDQMPQDKMPQDQMQQDKGQQDQMQQDKIQQAKRP